jgi:glycosyltransferase involved in cell wall biosynthesis
MPESVRSSVTPAPVDRPAVPQLTVVIPAFNEAASLPATLARVAAAAGAVTPRWETLVVDDGSRDDTAALVRAQPAALRCALLRLSRNFGKEAALTAGLDHARGDLVLILDADGQHPPELLPQMVGLWREGYDMVYGVRTDRAREPLSKRLGSRLFYHLLKSRDGFEIPPDAGDFRLLDRRVVQALRALPERRRFMKAMYAWVGYRSIALPFAPDPRQAGRSHYSRRQLTRLAWTGITGFSALPLRIATIVGGLFAAVAFAYGAYVIFEYFFFDQRLPGWPTVVVSLMFFSGVQLLFIGVVGEYLARVFDEVKGRPTYLVAEHHRPGPDADSG